MLALTLFPTQGKPSGKLFLFFLLLLAYKSRFLCRFAMRVDVDLVVHPKIGKSILIQLSFLLLLNFILDTIVLSHHFRPVPVYYFSHFNFILKCLFFMYKTTIFIIR